MINPFFGSDGISRKVKMTLQAIDISWMMLNLVTLPIREDASNYWVNLAPTLNYQTDLAFQYLPAVKGHTSSALLKIGPRIFCLTMPLHGKLGGTNKFFSRAIRIDLVAKTIIPVACLISKYRLIDLREIDIWQDIKSEWDKYIHTYNLLKLEEEKGFAIVQELFDGDLHSMLFSEHIYLTPMQLLQIATQLAEQVAYLHTHRIAHRDLKTENVLIKQVGYAVKAVIVDFGSAARKEELVENNGTWDFWSPEVWMRIVEDSLIRVDWYKNDIWALGTLFYLMFCVDLLPWDTDLDSMKNHYRAIKKEYKSKGSVPPKMLKPILRKMSQGLEPSENEPITNLIVKLLEYDADKRPDATLVATRFKQLASK